MYEYLPFDYDLFCDYAVRLCQYNHTVWLDSSDLNHKNAHYSFVMTAPMQVISGDLEGDLLDYLKTNPLFSRENKDKINAIYTDNPELPPFIGGFAGFLSYDYCVKQRFDLSNMPHNINTIPAFYGGIYDCVVFANHQTRQAGVIAININPTQSPKQRLKIVWDKMNKPSEYDGYDDDDYDDDYDADYECDIVFPKINPEIYKANVNKAKDYILQGDIFQANIARSVILERPHSFNALDFYQNLRHTNPSPFGCFIQHDNFQIMSASPERFLKIQDNIITAEPIKGTIQSHSNKTQDIEQQNILLNCPKNRAENMIIVDLLRNDITPFAKTGSIRAEKLCELQTFSGLHHLVSTITAELLEDSSVFDVLAMALPGGSITGAPKKRVCEIIYELENAQRGAYCGSAGFIGINGSVDMNILIRTVQADSDSIIFHTGCGITAQSDASQEWQETQTKAQKIIDSFG